MRQRVLKSAPMIELKTRFPYVDADMQSLSSFEDILGVPKSDLKRMSIFKIEGESRQADDDGSSSSSNNNDNSDDNNNNSNIVSDVGNTIVPSESDSYSEGLERGYSTIGVPSSPASGYVLPYSHEKWLRQRFRR